MLSDKERWDCEQWLLNHGITSYAILKNGEINVFGNVYLRSLLNMKMPYQFNEVHGNFHVNESNFNDLVGFPRSVSGYMKIYACNIHSMIGFTPVVGIEAMFVACTIGSLKGITRIDNLPKVSLESRVVLANSIIRSSEENFQTMYENIDPMYLDEHMLKGFDFSFDPPFRNWVLEKRRMETINAIVNEG